MCECLKGFRDFIVFYLNYLENIPVQKYDWYNLDATLKVDTNR